MEKTMLERVAAALYRRFPHGQLVQDARGAQALTGIPWDDLSASAKERWLADARAAMEEMRIPTSAMFAAGLAAPLPNECGMLFPGNHYQAMIDAALVE